MQELGILVSFPHYCFLEINVPAASRPSDRVGASEGKISRSLYVNSAVKSHTGVREPSKPPLLFTSLETFHSCLRGLEVKIFKGIYLSMP